MGTWPFGANDFQYTKKFNETQVYSLGLTPNLKVFQSRNDKYDERYHTKRLLTVQFRDFKFIIRTSFLALTVDLHSDIALHSKY